jgi:hypothetical protein
MFVTESAFVTRHVFVTEHGFVKEPEFVGAWQRGLMNSLKSLDDFYRGGLLGLRGLLGLLDLLGLLGLLGLLDYFRIVCGARTKI